MRKQKIKIFIEGETGSGKQITANYLSKYIMNFDRLEIHNIEEVDTFDPTGVLITIDATLAK